MRINHKTHYGRAASRIAALVLLLLIATPGVAQYLPQPCPEGNCPPIAGGALVPVRPGGSPQSEPRAAHHQAVVRIVNATGGSRSLGSGTLIDKDAQYGVVITCAHLFRDGVGQLSTTFPDGHTYGAKLLGIDPTWDLAALLIATPSAEPVELSAAAPQIGEALSSCGYGSDGRFWCNRGSALQYVVLGGTRTAETLELSGMARQGDSGGPIFNARGQLAGVLHGTNGQVVVGTFCGRVRKFLAQVWPNFGRNITPPGGANAPNGVGVGDEPDPTPRPTSPPASEPHDEADRSPDAPQQQTPSDGLESPPISAELADKLQRLEENLAAMAGSLESAQQGLDARDEKLRDQIAGLLNRQQQQEQPSAPPRQPEASEAPPRESAPRQANPQKRANPQQNKTTGGLSDIALGLLVRLAGDASGGWLQGLALAAGGALGIGTPALGVVLAIKLGRRWLRRRRAKRGQRRPAEGDEFHSAATGAERRLNDDYARQLADLFEYSGRSPVQDSTLGREYDRRIREAEASSDPAVAKFARALRDRVERTFHRVHGVSPAPAEPVN